MRKHAVGKLAAELQQARAVSRFRQRCPRPDRLPTREETRGQPVELGPQSVFAHCREIEIRGDGGCDAELSRTPVLRNVEIPGERIADRRIVPDSQAVQLAHGAAPG